MTFIKLIAIGFIFILIVSCSNNNKHTIILNSDHKLSEKLIPPSGCYKVQIIGTGSLSCCTRLNLFMDSKKTNSDHLILDGAYSNTEIYLYDWYDNTMELNLTPDSCVVHNFELIVTFFD